MTPPYTYDADPVNAMHGQRSMRRPRASRPPTPSHA